MFWVKNMKFSKGVGTGAAVLIVSGFVCKVLGALFRLPLTNILSIEGIGIFQLIMSLYAFALVITCGGVTVSLSKLISSARANEREEKIKIFLNRAILTSMIASLSLGVLFLLLGRYVCAFQGISNNYSYMLFILLLPFGALLAVFRGYFQGYEKMTPTAVSQILEQVFKFCFGIFFAWLFAKTNMQMGVFGAFLGIVLSEVVAVIFLFILYLRHKDKKLPCDFSSFQMAQKEFDSTNFTLMLTASVLPLVNAFDALIVVPRLVGAGFSNGYATTLFGLQSGVVGAILNIPLVISMSVATAFLPNLSFIFSKGGSGRHIVEKGLNLLLYLVLPTAFGCVAVARPLLSVLYRSLTVQTLDVAINLMIFGSFSIVFMAIMQFLVMLLQSQGQFKFILKSFAVGGSVKAILTFVLSGVAQVNIFSIVLGNICLSSIVCVMSLFKLKKTLVFKLNLKDLSILIFGTAMMFMAVNMFLRCDYFSTATNLLLAVLIGMFVYGVLTFSLLYKFFAKKKVSV